jgi:predicted amino acid-binding ACT domain protein
MSEIILINLTGRDRPGITRDLSAIRRSSTTR